MPDPSDPSFQSGFSALFVVFAVVIVIGIVVTIALFIRNASKVISSGHDPSTLQTDIALKLLDSQALSPTPPIVASTTEFRLAELDRLLAAGMISAAERTAARAAILAGH